MSIKAARRTRIRVVSHDDVVRNARLLLVDYDEDGNEIEARDVTEALKIKSIGIDLEVGAIARASVECLAVQAEIDATLDELVVRHVWPSFRARLRWRLWKVGHRIGVAWVGRTHRSYLA